MEEPLDYKLQQKTASDIVLPSEDGTPDQKAKKPVIRKCGLMVKEGVILPNVISMIFVLFNSLALLLFFEIASVYLLQSSDYFNLTSE